jgi:integrase
MARKKPTPRRSPNTGTIRYKKSRTLPWEAAFPIGHGQRRYDSFASRAEATAHLDRLTSERDSDEAPRNITGGSQRTDIFLTSWLNGKRGHVKEKTWLGYQYLCDLAVAEIGTYRIDEVSREKADAMLAYFHRRGFQNVSQMRIVQPQAFQYALDEGYTKRNPFQKAKAPPVQRRKGIALSRTQRAQLLAAFEGHPLCGLFHLYSRLGFRRGEGLGVRWAGVNLDAGTIRVTQHYVEVGSKNEWSTPKSPRSTREIPIPSDLVALLREHRAWQRTHAAQTKDWVEQGLVFPSERGTPISPRNIVRTLKAALKRVGLPEQITIHDLRHTAEYHLETAGVPESARMALLGHSTSAMARHYADHADMDAMRAALEKSA